MDTKSTIEQLQALNVPVAGIRAALKKSGASEEVIEEFLPKGERKSFKADFYDFLAEGSRTEAEFDEFIADNGTDNVVKHKSAHKMVWELAERIREAS